MGLIAEARGFGEELERTSFYYVRRRSGAGRSNLGTATGPAPLDWLKG